MRIRVGSVPYLNAEPLMGALRDRLRYPGVELSTQVPSSLIESLLAGDLDVALVSSAAVLPEPELRILPVGCVAARGAVRSIQVYARRRLEEVQTLALDSSSRSASALTRVVLRRRFGREPGYVSLPPDLPAMLAAADAALLIGDPALRANHALDSGDWPGDRVDRIDLGAEWLGISGLPFVYAIWAAPPDRDLAGITRVLSQALAEGLERLDEIALAGARRLEISPTESRAYLIDTIRYRLGDAEWSGLDEFCRMGRELGVLPDWSRVRRA